MENSEHQYHLNEWNCECNLVDFSGIPCSHLIALHFQLYDEFPQFLIDPRWKKETSSNDVAISFQRETVIDTLSNCNDSDVGNLQPSQLYHETFDQHSHSNLTKEERYVRILNMAKNICSISSKNVELTSRVMEKFHKLLDQVRGITEFDETDEELYFQTNEILTQNDQIQQNPAQEKSIQTVDHVDVIGKRKGRPRKPRKAKEYSKPIKCLICLRNHFMTDCPYYN